jgi:hypothetical protein
MPYYSAFPPLPRTGYDPFGAAIGGFERGLGAYNLALQSGEYQRALQRQQETRGALQQFGQTGDVSALMGVAPEIGMRMEAMRSRTLADRVKAAGEYFDVMAPFLTKESLPEFYRTLESKFGVPTRGWTVPKTDEEFGAILQRMTQLSGKLKAGHVLVIEDPSSPGGYKVVPTGQYTPHLVREPAPHGIRLYQDPDDPENVRPFPYGKEPTGWKPYIKEKEGKVLSEEERQMRIADMAFKNIQNNPVLGQEYANASPERRGEMLKEQAGLVEKMYPKATPTRRTRPAPKPTFRGPGRYRGPDGKPIEIRTQEEFDKAFSK